MEVQLRQCWPRHLMKLTVQLQAPAALPPGIGPKYQLDMRLSVTQNRSGRYVEEKIFFSLPAV